MKKFILVILLGISLGGYHSNAFSEPPPGEFQSGRDIYTRHCLRCHGANGNGQGPDAGVLTIKPTDFLSTSSRAQSDMNLLETVVWGSVYSPMHGWWDQLSPQETRDVVAYIRPLAPYRPQ